MIDDAELERIKNSYPVIWKDKNATPKLCFMGCPHMTYDEVSIWTDKLTAALKKSGEAKVTIPTVFTASPGVIAKFRQTEKSRVLDEMGVILSPICPLMYMNNPLAAKKPVITNSNKLRTYTSSRYYTDDEIVEKITRRA